MKLTILGIILIVCAVGCIGCFIGYGIYVRSLFKRVVNSVMGEICTSDDLKNDLALVLGDESLYWFSKSVTIKNIVAIARSEKFDGYSDLYEQELTELVAYYWDKVHTDDVEDASVNDVERLSNDACSRVKDVSPLLYESLCVFLNSFRGATENSVRYMWVSEEFVNVLLQIIEDNSFSLETLQDVATSIRLTITEFDEYNDDLLGGALRTAYGETFYDADDSTEEKSEGESEDSTEDGSEYFIPESEEIDDTLEEELDSVEVSEETLERLDAADNIMKEEKNDVPEEKADASESDDGDTLKIESEAKDLISFRDGEFQLRNYKVCVDNVGPLLVDPNQPFTCYDSRYIKFYFGLKVTLPAGYHYEIVPNKSEIERHGLIVTEITDESATVICCKETMIDFKDVLFKMRIMED